MLITVPGANNTPVTISTSTGDAQNYAAQIGALLSTIQGAGALSVTTDSLGGAIPPLSGEVGLQGSASDYIIAYDNGPFYVSDTVDGRDGVQILPADSAVVFSSGEGIFDPTGSVGDVSRLYQALLDRASTAPALEYWAGQIDSSQISLADVADAIAASPEFTELYGTLSNSDFINQVYQNTLGRAPDNGGLTFWAAALGAGATRGTVAAAIAESQEAKADSITTAGDNDNAEVYRLYETTFGRAPDADGAAYWASALANGTTVGQMAASLAGSSEFMADYGDMSIPEFLTSIYQNALQRGPDEDGLNFWTAVINDGGDTTATVASVLVAFADSLESRIITAPATHANWVFAPLTNELVLNGPGGLNETVPAGYHYIVANDAAADTLTASSAVIVTNTVGGTFNVSGNSTVAATGGDNTVNASGNYSLSFGPGNDSINATGSGNIAVGAGSSTINAADGSTLVVQGGTGSLDFVGGATAATVLGGTGGSSIFGGSGSDVTFGGPNNLDYTAATGNATLNAGTATGDITASLSGSTASIVGGSGNDSITVGSGSETLDAGSGTNQYYFLNTITTGQTITINDSVANVANDTFNFFGYSAPTDSGPGAPYELTLSDNTKVIFTNLTSVVAQAHFNTTPPP